MALCAAWLQLCIPAPPVADPTLRWAGPIKRVHYVAISRSIALQLNRPRQWKMDFCRRGGKGRTGVRVRAIWGQMEKPTFVELIPITGEAHFDQVMEDGRPVVVDWMAAWCRKCIYLKPKLEKLAAEYHPDIQFYVVDVNAVPSSLVKRAGVTKMPTIQLWKNKEKQGEVIGGEKAWLVLDQVRSMLRPDS